MTPIQIAIDASIKAGFKGDSLKTAIAIAGKESGFNPNAIGDENLQTDKWGASIGLYQIRSLKNPNAYGYPDNLRDANKLTNPYYNAQVAYVISKKGNDFSAWRMFNNGMYKSILNLVEAAIENFNPIIAGGSVALAAAVLLIIFWN